MRGLTLLLCATLALCATSHAKFSVQIKAETADDSVCEAMKTASSLCVYSAPSDTDQLSVSVCSSDDVCAVADNKSVADFAGEGVSLSMDDPPTSLKLSNGMTDGWLVGTLTVVVVDTSDASSTTVDLSWVTPVWIDGLPYDQYGGGGFKVTSNLEVPLTSCHPKPAADTASVVQVTVSSGDSAGDTGNPVLVSFHEDGPDNAQAQAVTALLFDQISSGEQVKQHYSLPFIPRLLSIHATSTDGVLISSLEVSVQAAEMETVAVDLSWAFPAFLDGRPYGKTSDAQGQPFPDATTNMLVLSLQQCQLPSIVPMPCLSAGLECPQSGVVDVYSLAQCGTGLDDSQFLELQLGGRGCLNGQTTKDAPETFDKFFTAFYVDSCFYLTAVRGQCDGTCPEECQDAFGSMSESGAADTPQSHVDLIGEVYSKDPSLGNATLDLGQGITLQVNSLVTCAAAGGSALPDAYDLQSLMLTPWPQECEADGLDPPLRFQEVSEGKIITDSEDDDDSSDAGEDDDGDGSTGVVFAILIPWLLVGGGLVALGVLWYKGYSIQRTSVDKGPNGHLDMHLIPNTDSDAAFDPDARELA